MGVIPGFLLLHAVTIEAPAGQGPFGPAYAAPVTVRCMVDEQTRMIRSATGDQVVSGATVYAPPGTVAPVGSRVTLPSGRVATVLAVSTRDGGGLATPDHVEVALT